MFGWFNKQHRRKQAQKSPTVHEIIEARKARLDARRVEANRPRVAEVDTVDQALDIAANGFAPTHSDDHITRVPHHEVTHSISHYDSSSHSSHDSGGYSGGDSGGGDGGGGSD